MYLPLSFGEKFKYLLEIPNVTLLSFKNQTTLSSPLTNEGRAKASSVARLALNRRGCFGEQSFYSTINEKFFAAASLRTFTVDPEAVYGP